MKVRNKLIAILILVSLIFTSILTGAYSRPYMNSNPFEAFDGVFLNSAGQASGEGISLYDISTSKPKEIKVDFLVKFLDSISLDEVYSSVKAFSYKPIGLSVERLFGVSGISENEFKKINEGIIEYTSPVVSRKLLRMPNDPESKNQWPISVLNLNNAWNITVGSKSVKIAVLDSGVDRSSKEIKFDNILPGYDIYTGKTVKTDENGHGTAVVSILSAQTNNGFGMAGVCWNVSVVPIKIYDENNETDTAKEVEALKLAAASGCKIINMSFGGEGKNVAEEKAIQELAKKGILVFAAAGNNGEKDYEYPASYDKVFSVAACDSNGNRWIDSNFNDKVDISAPGKDVVVIMKDGKKFVVGNGSGTSFASPHAAGIAALACSLAPDVNYQMFYNALKSVCRDKGDKGRDNYYGFGIIDAKKLLDYANANWINFEPVESIGPVKYTVNSSSAPHPGTKEVIPKISGHYFFKSLGTKDSDINIYDVKSDGKGGLYYDLAKAFAGDSLKSPKEVLAPFALDVELSKEDRYLVDAYANNKLEGQSISFLMFSPYEMFSRHAKIYSGNLVSEWKQEVVYEAKYSGQKTVVLKSESAEGSADFAVYKNKALIATSDNKDGVNSCTFDANAGDKFIFELNLKADTVWDLKVNENNVLYNAKIKNINVEGGKLNKRFNPNVFEYNVTATDRNLTLYWETYFSNVITSISGKPTRTIYLFVLGGANKTIEVNSQDSSGNRFTYSFHVNANPKVVGTLPPSTTSNPITSPKPTSTPKLTINSLSNVVKSNQHYLSIPISWSKKAVLSLVILDYKNHVVRKVWKKTAGKAGKAKVLWNFRNSKNTFVKTGLYQIKLVAGTHYISRYFRKV